MYNKELPYCGKKGQIKWIKLSEDGKFILVARWGATKKEKETIVFVPNTEENRKDLELEYMSSLKYVIDYDNSKYETYCKTLNLKRYNNKSLYSVITVSLAIMGISISLLSTNDLRGIIGIQSLIFSFTAFSIALRFCFENLKDDKKKLFISKHETRVNEYNVLDKTYNKTYQNDKTKYRILEKDKNTVKERNIVKTLEKTAN